MKFQVGSGLNEYLSQLQNLEFTAHDAMGKAIYEGAAIVADAIKRNIDSIPTDERYVEDSEKLKGIKAIQKKGLEHGFGIAKMRDDNGYYHVKVGFSGNNSLKTKSYPQGQPNSRIARSIESGNSYTQKHPFIAPAVRATKTTAEKRMAEVIDRETAKAMK